MIGVALLIVSVLVFITWFILEFKRLKHRIFAIFIIVFIIFLYLSMTIVFKYKNVDYKTIPGIMDATKIYFSWLFSVSGNFKSITTNAIQMDWSGNNQTAK